MRTHGLRCRKYSKRFDMFDSDADGLIRESDFLEVATRLERSFYRNRSPYADQLRDRYQKLWRSLTFAYDQDPATTISRAQFVAACAADDLLGFRHLACLADRTAIDLCGIDRGYLFTTDEAVDMLAAMGATAPGDRADIRILLDKQVHAPLSVAAVCRLVRTFYTSEDPSVPGNQIFGRLPSSVGDPQPVR